MGPAARGIASLIKQLAVRLPAVVRTVRDVASVVREVRSSQRAGDPRLTGLEEALELQARLNDKLMRQLEATQAVLERLQKSLRLAMITAIAAALLSIIAIVLVLVGN